MHKPIRNLLLVVIIAGVISGASTLVPSSARAYHTYHERLLDTTANSLQRRRFRLGLFKLSYGIFDHLQLTTYTAPWLLGALFEDVAPNLEFRSTFYDHKRLALSGSFAFITGTIEQISDVEESKIRYYLFPVSLASSVRINRWVSTHLGLIYTGVTGEANSSPGTTDIEGGAVVDVFQLWAMAEWRLSRVVAFTFTVRWVPWVSDTIVRGRLTGDQSNPDIGVGIEIKFIDLTNAFAVIPGFVFSWKRANIKLGVGYGDFFVESLGFPLVIPRSLLSNIAPEFDVFVRF